MESERTQSPPPMTVEAISAEKRDSSREKSVPATEKRQPWKDFLMITEEVKTQGHRSFRGDNDHDEIRLMAQLDDKVLGG
ncbi:hypothetical protein N7456_002313 [Penicillium angulare]|uniref:Uncharacterized protein n=1 Tax=Penicillium angulare TaxID=116970 RepID=A0A9W9G881_9EURO|nr:hypothetical protein N7456_002313 [Penicillium angulare]